MAEAYVVIQHEQVQAVGMLTCGEFSRVPSLWSLSESPSASMICCRELARGSVLTVMWRTIRACANAVTTYLVPNTVHRRAGSKTDSMLFCAIPLWVTVSWWLADIFFTHCSQATLTQFLGAGAQPTASGI